MKFRIGFVSNSSSTAFMITNLTDEVKTLLDFVEETPWIIEDYLKDYGDCVAAEGRKEHTQEKLIESAKMRVRDSKGDGSYTWEPHESKYCSFGDEDGDLIGRVYDYMLRGISLKREDLILEKISSLPQDKVTSKMREEFFDILSEDYESPNRKSCFGGVESTSFKVEFEEWLR